MSTTPGFTPGFELRDQGDGNLHLAGYACVTGVSYPVGFYTETVKHGAFKRTLSEDPAVVLLVNHAGLPLASTRTGTLTLAEDAHGLLVDADLDPLDPDVQAIERKLRRGDVSEMSFAFQVTDQEWNDDYSARIVRTASLHKGDVSVVTFGANDATTVHIRARGTLGERTTTTPGLPFEQRRRLAEDIGKRATGGGRLSLVGDRLTASRRRTPTTVDIPIPNYTARARSRYEAIRFPRR